MWVYTAQQGNYSYNYGETHAYASIDGIR